MIAPELRDKYRATCPVFGIDDDDGKPGIDESCMECQGCQKADGEMWQACSDECEQDRAGEGEKSATEALWPPGQPDTGEKEMTDETNKTDEKEQTDVAEKPEKPTKVKKVKKASRMDVLIELVNDHTPRTKKEMTEKIAERLPQFTMISLQVFVAGMMRFTKGIGAVEVDEDKRYTVKR